MPVLLTTPEESRTWVEASTEEALTLQRPLPEAMMRGVKRGERRVEALPAVEASTVDDVARAEAKRHRSNAGLDRF